MKKSILMFGVLLSSISYSQKYLIENFAGHRCPNCPTADSTVLAQKAIHGDDLIFTTIHAAPDPSGTWTFQDTSPEFPNDLTNQNGRDYGAYMMNYGLFANPMLMCNRIDYGTNEIAFLVSTIEDRISNAPPLATEFDLFMTPMTSSHPDSMTFSTSIPLYQQVTGDYSLVLYVIEDSVISAQQNGGVTDQNYIHRNLHRKTLYDTWGQHKIDNTTPVSTITDEHTFYIDPSWQADQIGIIAYIYDESNKEIRELAKMNIGELSVNSPTSELEFGLYPNPSNSVINLQLKEAAEISIINQLGQIVKRIDKNSLNLHVDISDLPKGIYNVKATTKNISGTKQFVKL